MYIQSQKSPTLTHIKTLQFYINLVIVTMKIYTTIHVHINILFISLTSYQWRSHTQRWGPRPPQNFKKLIYSMYIIYIFKNVACKN